MASLEQALALATQGFHVFPLIQNSKLPAIDAWQTKATTDAKQIERWWLDPAMGWDQDYNIGICTSRFNGTEHLLALDIDNKGKMNGDAEVIKLELEGNDFPSTREHLTPTGGRHLLYRVRHPVPNSASKIAPGLDTRGEGGYVVAPGSVIDGKPYSGIDRDISPAPEWLVERVGQAAPKKEPAAEMPAAVDPDRAVKRAMDYLATAPIAVEGEAGDTVTYQVACRLKDFGCTEDQALDLMLDWNAQCCPPWSDEELANKIANAYRYGREAPGVAAPEAQFPPIGHSELANGEGGKKHPFARINDEYTFIKRGAMVLREYYDHKGRFKTDHLSVAEFHHIFTNRPFPRGKVMSTESREWMASPQRRQYDGVVFSPERDPGAQWYNLWRGFRVEEADSDEHPSVAMFKEHALKNVCGSDPVLFDWLMGYFAHLIQKPYEKPLVALVFKGKKGTGKNALVERVGHLLGGHFLVADDGRYLTGNFNSHLESCLFMVLDEAAWAGDKKAEGRLKGLITGAEHTIERKGQEPYTVDNLTRVAIIGNEDWLVPASAEGERRFAVFTMGEGRMKDNKFFEAMRVGMENGGYAHLLHYLRHYKITQSVNVAPNTEGLLQQKLESLSLVQQWWRECLEEGRVVGSDFSEGWPEAAPTKPFHRAFVTYCRGMNIKARIPSSTSMGKAMANMIPSWNACRHKARNLSEGTYEYRLGELADRREDFERMIGHKMAWGDA